MEESPVPALQKSVVPGHQEAGAPFRVEPIVEPAGPGNPHDQTVAVR